MNAAAVRGLISRRGSLIGWQHARPINPQEVDEFTQGPKKSLGEIGQVPVDDRGAFGEHYLPEVQIRAYATGKISNIIKQAGGIIEAGDMELCIPVPYVPELGYDIEAVDAELLTAYNEGNFATLADSPTLAAFDRFRFLAKLWIARTKPTPIVDQNVVVAWRLLVTKYTT